MENNNKIHIGSLIKKVFNEKHISVIDFASKIKRERTVVYDIFERESVDIYLLREISKALDYDFIGKVYFTEDNSPKTSKVFIAFEIEESEIEKLNLPKNILCLVRKK